MRWDSPDPLSQATGPVKAEHVLRLGVTAIDAQRLKVIDPIEELEENVFDEVVSAKITRLTSLLKHFAGQIIIKTEIHYESV